MSVAEPETIFEITPPCLEAYPALQIGLLIMRGVANPSENAALEAQKTALETQLRGLFSGLDRSHIAALAPIQAYDAYYKRFNKSYHVQLQLESIALKGKPIPRVAALVEAMFMAEVKNLLLTAGHDLESLQLPLSLAIAEGTESYTLLRGTEQTLKKGDLYIQDGLGIISSILYGPDQRTQLRPGTQNALFTIYAPEGIIPETLVHHLIDLHDYIKLITPEAQPEKLTIFDAGRPREK